MDKTELGSPHHQVSDSWSISVGSKPRSRPGCELDGSSSSFRCSQGCEADEDQVQEKEELQLGFAQ